LFISVAGQGMGVSKEDLKPIFNKFYRTNDILKTHAGRLGMGLFVTSKIINNHGGKIWAEREIGVGSTFFFTLPITKR
jgi:signal transduction histidine kinase